MKKSVFLLLILFVLLTTYTPKFDSINISSLLIKKIIIKNNSIIETDKLKKKISFLYDENLFFLNVEDIEKKIKKENFIESFSIKKIYPNTLKLMIVEKKPIAILQNKKEKFYISNKGDIISFQDLEIYRKLPIVFGTGKSFYLFYQDLNNIKFPVEKIKSFYFFEIGRWDMILKDGKTIKLPINEYKSSLKNFMKSQSKSEFENYKTFDYRIKDQLILN